MDPETYFSMGYAKMMIFRRINDYENVEYFCKLLIRPGGLKEEDYRLDDGEEENTIVGVLPIFKSETPKFVNEKVIKYTNELSKDKISDENFLKKLPKIDKKLMREIKKQTKL